MCDIVDSDRVVAENEQIAARYRSMGGGSPLYILLSHNEPLVPAYVSGSKEAAPKPKAFGVRRFPPLMPIIRRGKRETRRQREVEDV